MAVGKAPPSWKTQSWLLSQHHKATKRVGVRSQGGSWSTLTCSLQSICSLHYQLPGLRTQILAPVSSACDPKPGPQQALPLGPWPASMGPMCPSARVPIAAIWERRPLAVSCSEVK